MNSLDPNPSKNPTKVEVPKQLPKVSMVNTSLKKHKHHLAGFDVVVKERTMLIMIIEGSWGFEHIKACFRDEIIPFVKALKEQGLIIAALRDKLRKLKGKAIVDNAVTTHTIDPEMLKVDVEPIALRLLNNRTVHSDYLRLTQEQTAILREVVEQGKSQNPLNNSLDHASSSSNLVSNKPALSSTGVKPSTCASESQPLGITKNDKIQRPPSSTQKNKVIQIVLWYLDSSCSKHMTEDRSQLTMFINKFFGTVKFGNDHVAKIMGYGDYQIGNVTISRYTCFIHNLEGVDLQTRSRGSNLYTLSLGDMMAFYPICLLSNALKTKSWLWHRRLSHLNFGTINHLAIHGLVRGLPKIKIKKDHMCSAYVMGKSKKKPHKPKSEDTNQEKLYLLHLDLCGPMRVASVNEKNVDHLASKVIAPITEVVALKSAASISSPSSTTVDQDVPSF
nr:hypothetical protein [Tanacetum cinerariifolium]